MGGHAHRAHAAPHLPGTDVAGAQLDADRAAVQFDYEVGPVGGLRISPAQEVQVVPPLLGQVTGTARRLASPLVQFTNAVRISCSVSGFINDTLICLIRLGKCIIIDVRYEDRLGGRAWQGPDG